MYVRRGSIHARLRIAARVHSVRGSPRFVGFGAAVRPLCDPRPPDHPGRATGGGVIRVITLGGIVAGRT
jgi:hypothetical protein